MRVMGSGSRSMVVDPNAVEIYKHLEQKVFILADTDPDFVLISGLAEGWDEAIAKIGLRNGIPYEAYIPHPTYGEYYWGKNSLLGVNRLHTFNELRDGAQKIHISSQTLYMNGLHANFIRNQDMVDTCNGALVYQANSSGTRDAIARLKKANKPYQVYPFDLQIPLF